MQPAGYGGLDHERTPLQRPRFSRQAVLAAPLFAAVAGLVILVVLELAPESALHRASLASALQAPITADHHHRNITLGAPRVAALAESGLSLRSHYAAHECTPSRGSLLSGRYPVRLGLQRGVVSAASKWGLDPAIRLLPETLQTAGYRTALVGKWHLGHYNESLTPARRGFGESYGFLGGFVDHFTHVAKRRRRASETPATDGTCALDWQVNGLPRPRATGVYAAYASSWASTTPTGGGAAGAIRRGKWKLLVNVRREPVYDGSSEAGVRYLDDEPRSFLYDVEADPGESEDVYDAEPDIAAALEKRLVELHVAAEAPRYCAPTRAELDARAAFAARGNVVQPWAPSCGPATGPTATTRAGTPTRSARTRARGLLAPAACDGASARS
ncbi:sulfuric ester hydrolase [Aureococcus anophagefferens]|nr:sulfuric ester hydrolase [Aureococcus anophagefferens]